MLDATDVLIDRKPVLRGLGVKRSMVVVRVCVTVEIPGRVDEGIHGIGFAARRAAALGTSRVDELGYSSERRSTGERDINIFRQDNRQIFFRHRNDAIFFAIKHRDRRPPIALARDSPIFQPIRGGGFAKTVFFGMCGHLLNGIGTLKAAVWTGVDQHAIVADKRKSRLGHGFFRVV